MEEKLGAWMRETGNSNWSIGCRLMMWRYNTQIHRTVDDVPYNLLFGHMPRVGISNLPLANELIDTLATEAQLNRVCDYVGKVDIPDENNDAVLVGEIENIPMASNESDDAVLVGEIGEISEREASREESVVGGQGYGTVICSCKGKCDSKICKCFKAGRTCSSACHRNNKNCTNHDSKDTDEL
jgi:hypothetical protein